MRPPNPKNAHRAFTLIELMVVILILATLAALIVPNVMKRVGEARAASVKSDEATLASALNQFRLDCDRYPTAEEGLNALVTAPAGLEGKAKEPYLTKTPVPNDPWGNPYVYQVTGSANASETFTLASYGSDGQPGGAGDAADIVR